jgi:hypothetical protein
MTKAQIIALQERIGTKPDGIWGDVSTAACQRHLRALMPTPHPWPTGDDASVIARFGQPGDESQLVNLPVIGLGVKYDGAAVRSIRCHRLVAHSLIAAIADIADTPSAWILGQYAGCYNYRKMRGGSRHSKHAWGIAVDFAPATNGLRTHWPRAATMPIEAMEAFARQGWLSAGAFWSRDAMHFETTR